MSSGHLKRLCILLLVVVNCFINDSEVLLVDSVFEFLFSFADFLIVLSVGKKEVLKSPTVIVDFSVSSFISIDFFTSHVLQLCCSVHTHWDCCVFLVD